VISEFTFQTILAVKLLDAVEGFAEALGTKLKEKRNYTFRKQSCKFFACPEAFSAPSEE